MAIIVENKNTIVERGLSEWWSEEAEYVLQRIEKWAAFARGYNRLRSLRWSKSQQMIQSVSSCKVSSKKPASTQSCSLKRSRQKSNPEESKINCCGTFSYQSNSELDSNCLETYRYDHSIYFKTIGDMRKDKDNVKYQD